MKNNEMILWYFTAVPWIFAFILALFGIELWQTLTVAHFGSYFFGAAMHCHFGFKEKQKQ